MKDKKKNQLTDHGPDARATPKSAGSRQTPTGKEVRNNSSPLPEVTASSPRFEFSPWEIDHARRVLIAIKGWFVLARRGADDERVLFQIAAGVAPGGRRVGDTTSRGKYRQLGIVYGGEARLMLDVPKGRGDMKEYAGLELVALARAAFEIPQVKELFSEETEDVVGSSPPPEVRVAGKAEPSAPPAPSGLRRIVAIEQIPNGHFLRPGHFKPRDESQTWKRPETGAEGGES